MSGYIGTDPKKILRGWVEVPTDERIDNYIPTEDTAFSTNPVKEYYELVSDEYVLTSDFYQDPTTGEWTGTMQPGKTYYENHPHYVGTVRKTIKKGWLGDVNKVPQLVLDAVIGYEHNLMKSILPHESPSAVVYNGRIHALGSSESDYRTTHYSFNSVSGEWEHVSTLPNEFSQGSPYRAPLVYKGILHLFGGSGSGSVYEDFCYDFYWDGSEWVRNDDIPNIGTFLLYNNEIHIIRKDGHWIGTANDELPNYIRWVSGEAPPATVGSYSDVLFFVYDNKIHVIGSAGSYYCHYTWDSTNGWVQESDTSTIQSLLNGKSVSVLTPILYDGKIYLFARDTSRNIYIYDGTNWSLNSFTMLMEIPYGNIILHNGKVNLIGGGNSPGSDMSSNPKPLNNYKRHYEFDMTNGNMSEDTVVQPYEFIGGSVVNLNDELHILGSGYIQGHDRDPMIDRYIRPHMTKHYKHNGSNWIKDVDIPLNFYSWDGSDHRSSAVIYNNKIHIFVYHTYPAEYEVEPFYHYVFDGSTWSQASAFPISDYGVSYCSALYSVVYDNRLHVMGIYEYNNQEKTFHYSWNGTTWRSEASFIYNTIIYPCGCMVVFDGKIYHLYNDHYCNHPNYNPQQFLQYNKTKVMCFDGTSWNFGTDLLDVVLINTQAVVCRNKLHIMGSSINQFKKSHYSWDGTAWAKEKDLVRDFCRGAAVVKDDEIYMFGGGTESISGSSYETNDVNLCQITNFDNYF